MDYMFQPPELPTEQQHGDVNRPGTFLNQVVTIVFDGHAAILTLRTEDIRFFFQKAKRISMELFLL